MQARDYRWIRLKATTSNSKDDLTAKVDYSERRRIHEIVQTTDAVFRYAPMVTDSGNLLG